MLPCADAPGQKATYTATVKAPRWATVLMSALGEGQEDSEAGLRVWHYRQPVACSSYLIAVAVGDLASKEVSPRCRVWR